MTDSIIASLRTLGDRYEIGELIGQGGMAQVHLARDTRLDRQVAVKLLKPELSKDPEFRTRFRQEAQSAARMSHPTVVRVFDAGEEPTTDAHGEPAAVPYIVMEYVDGRMVKDIIAEGPLPEAEAVRITKGILTALEYSHRAGIVHRDIKPGNVMVTPGGQIKVMDFGIARAVSETSANVAETGTILGTAGYFSPEQARGESVDARTDLYSTGVVLFELLTGQPPFQSDTPVGIAYQHVAEEPPTTSSITPGITPEMDSVVAKALQKPREDRFQTATEFKQALDDALAGVLVPLDRPTTAPIEIGAATTMFAALHVDEPETEAQAEAAQERRRRPHLVWLWAAAVLIGVLVVGAGVWAFSLGNLPIAGLSTPVPDVVGAQEDEAIATIDAEGLRAEVRRTIDDAPAGTVLRTEPEAGVSIAPGSTVQLVVSNGPPPEPLMSVANLTEAQARQALESAGYTVGEITRDSSPTVQADHVISTDPSAGTSVSQGAIINLVLSNGRVEVPDVVGSPIAAAVEELQAAGLTVERRFTLSCLSDGTVREQSLIGEQPQGSTITILYCNGSPQPAPQPAPQPDPEPSPSNSGGGNGNGGGNNGGGNGPGNGGGGGGDDG
ncbi:Stk1 family PASTA domain-containing Ser/Thr kinase [Agrococcus carbonis]|uniref:non-specific serine/threonine protein kinase n=1 Tax=Agrococcus carbonis TaxID=684552 RepID=A0A1H1PA58_9MICO|nr:Stk1 family PASTA domain-containing Ser/Thr kinase [Agrococcus carbonis]SDS08004.1 serine/threonine protein kinase [Agrococcus carbonis]